MNTQFSQILFVVVNFIPGGVSCCRSCLLYYYLELLISIMLLNLDILAEYKIDRIHVCVCVCIYVEQHKMFAIEIIHLICVYTCTCCNFRVMIITLSVNASGGSALIFFFFHFVSRSLYLNFFLCVDAFESTRAAYEFIIGTIENTCLFEV